MAQFFARIQGARGEALRLGNKQSGIRAKVASWQGAVYVEIFHNAATGEDIAFVKLAPWNGEGRDLMLYHGPVSGKDAKTTVEWRPSRDQLEKEAA
jgi:hypothetical protein